MARLLIIDDDHTFRDALEEILQVYGYTTLTATDGYHALRLLEDDKDFDLILSDIQMPGLNGIDLLEKLQKSYRHIPVIMLTGQNDVNTAVQAMQRGALNYVLKDNVDSVIQGVVQDAIDTHRKIVQTLMEFQPIVKQFLSQQPQQERREHTLGTQLILNTTSRIVNYSQQPIQLTTTEFDILECLMKAQGKVCRYEQIIIAIHNQTVSPDEAKQTLSAHISNLRYKLKVVGCNDAIVTQRKLGYYLNSKYV